MIRGAALNPSAAPRALSTAVATATCGVLLIACNGLLTPWNDPSGVGSCPDYSLYSITLHGDAGELSDVVGAPHVVVLQQRAVEIRCSDILLVTDESSGKSFPRDDCDADEFEASWDYSPRFRTLIVVVDAEAFAEPEPVRVRVEVMGEPIHVGEVRVEAKGAICR